MSESMKPYGLTVVRATLGLILLMHGIANTIGRPGIAGFTETVKRYAGFAPTAIAWLAAIAELVVGVMLIIGMLPRAMALLAMAMAAGSLWLKGNYTTFFLPDGAEHLLALLAMSTCVWLAGPGKWAINIQVKKSQ